MNEQLAFKLGRAFKLGMMYGMGRKYADLGKARDAEENPKGWITIKNAHIPLDKDGSLSGEAGEKIEASHQNQKFKLDDFTRDLDQGKNPRTVLKEAAQSLKGSYSVSLPDVGVDKVILGKNFVFESGKYLYTGEGKANPKKRKEIAQRQLFGMSKLQTILSEGVKTKWSNNRTHHGDRDFITIYKNLPYQGSKVVFSVDISRKKDTPKDEEKQIYNVGNSRNQGFVKKQKHSVVPIKHAKDSFDPESYEIVRIRS